MNELPSMTRALLEAAKSEAPSMAARAKIWSGVSAASGAALAGGAAGAASASSGLGAGGGVGGAGSMGAAVGVSAATGAVGAAKLLVMGALFGSAITVGLAATLLYVRPSPAPIHAETQIAASVATVLPASMMAPPSATSMAIPSAIASTASSAASSATTIAATRPSSVGAAPVVSTEDALMREASLIAEARSALVRGDANAALRAVRAARRLPSHQLEPEELALEAQALRLLGRDDEATSVDGALRGKYPDHALAR